MDGDEFFNDPRFQAIYRDTYTFTLDGVIFTIRCKIDSFGVVYFPDASKNDQTAPGRMLPWRNTFNDLTFVDPPQWLITSISSDNSMFTPAQKARPRQGEPAQPPELYIPLWELPDIQGPLRHWAKEHPFIERERELITSWKSRRGCIEVCKYALQEEHHLEISSYDTVNKCYGEKTRIAGNREQLVAVGLAMAQVAGAKEVKRHIKKRSNILAFPH